MIHKSAKGRIINFAELAQQNPDTIAVGNANLNARGDLIGPGGKIIQTAEERGKSSTSTLSTTKASIQSEISSLKASRNQWTESEGIKSEAVQEVTQEPAQEASNDEIADEHDKNAEEKPTSKKPRKIVESD